MRCGEKTRASRTESSCSRLVERLVYSQYSYTDNDDNVNCYESQDEKISRSLPQPLSILVNAALSLGLCARELACRSLPRSLADATGIGRD